MINIFNMQKISFNKLFNQKNKVPCAQCRTEMVSINKVGGLCDNCGKVILNDKGNNLIMGKRDIAAVLDVGGQRVYVDKFGREVDNTIYDLDNDPRGWEATGNKKKGKML